MMFVMDKAHVNSMGCDLRGHGETKEEDGLRGYHNNTGEQTRLI